MRCLFRAIAVFILACTLPSAFGGPQAYVHTPIVEYGEREIDVHGGRQEQGDGTRASGLATGFGMGLTPWWFTEAYGIAEWSSGEPVQLTSIEWENVFQLTETGRRAAELGLLFEVERPRDLAEGYELVYGPLVQTDVGRVQLNGNLLIQRHVRASTPSDTVLQYEWQAKFRWREALEPGLQGFGEMGQWNRWEHADLQSHVIGPAVFGKLRLGGHQALRYDAAFLVGISPAAPDRTLRLRVEYEY
ncbi:MAG: hypothetical protein ACREVQ_14840 [Burkholderiales bacterium]